MHASPSRNRLTAEAYSRLSSAIVERRWPPGLPLLETALARDFGMSRTPVREALQLLANEGLVVDTPAGLAVAELTVKDVRDLMQTSRALHVLGCRLAVERATDEQTDRLAQLAAEMERAAAVGDVERWIGGDVDLHRCVLEMADNAPLLRMSRQLDKLIARVRHLAVRQPGRLARSNGEHRRVVEALRGRRAEEAEQAIWQHLKTSEENLIDVLQNYVVPFKGARF